MGPLCGIGSLQFGARGTLVGPSRSSSRGPGSLRFCESKRAGMRAGGWWNSSTDRPRGRSVGRLRAWPAQPADHKPEDRSRYAARQQTRQQADALLDHVVDLNRHAFVVVDWERFQAADGEHADERSDQPAHDGGGDCPGGDGQ